MALALIFSANTKQFHLPPKLLSSICYVESSYNINAVHKDDGREDSNGVCQVQLSSARHMGYKGTKKHLMDPGVNAYYAAKILSYQIKRYKGNLPRAITAYNKGHSSGDGHSAYYQKVVKRWQHKEAYYAKNL